MEGRQELTCTGFRKDEKLFIDENRICQLHQHDVIVIIVPPKNQKMKYKILDKISVGEVISNIYGWHVCKNTDIYFKIIKIDYKKFPWWNFWKRKKYVIKYYLEVM